MCRRNDKLTMLKSKEKVPWTTRLSKKSTTEPLNISTTTRQQNNVMLASVVATSESTSDRATISASGQPTPSPETIPALTDENFFSKLISRLESELEADREQTQELRDLRTRLDELIALNIANEESLYKLQQKLQQEGHQYQASGHHYGLNELGRLSFMSTTPAWPIPVYDVLKYGIILDPLGLQPAANYL